MTQETHAPSRRLRVARIRVQPELVWDDGEVIEDGPALQPLALSLRQLDGLADGLLGQVAAMQAQADAELAEDPAPLPDE